MIAKNRTRENYSFANINFMGKCNCNCYFCLGKDLEDEILGKSQLGIHYSDWKNFDYFLGKCAENNVKKLYLTGQNCDPLQYKHLEGLIYYLKEKDFLVGLRSNGYLALDNISAIKKMNGGIGYSIHSLNPLNNELILGRSDLPNWDKIIPLSGDNVRASIVLNRHNAKEFFSICKYLSKFENLRYIQLRKISTDSRFLELKEDLKLYDDFFEVFKNLHPIKGFLSKAPFFEIFGKQLVFWKTVETSVNSLNYFTDGTCSDEYFVVEGYLKNR